MNKVKKVVKACFEGDLTMPKAIFWLTGAVCLLAGIVYGLLAAPMTHGIMIGSYSGNSYSGDWKKAQDEGDCTDDADKVN